MASSLKLRHLPRYGGVLHLLVGHRDVLVDGEQGSAQDAARLVRELQDKGPAYVKLGQLLSSRVDLLPPAYVQALGQLRDQAEPVEFNAIRDVIEDELGARLETLFASFDRTPLGAASTAQVHRATLPGGGLVAVKVQRSGVRRRMVDDLEVIAELAGALDDHVDTARRAGLSQVVAEFRRSVMAELDYRQEAGNLRTLAMALEPYPRLACPLPVDELSTQRVLTMTLVEGQGLGSISEPGHQISGGDELVEQLFKAYLDQVLMHGVFHADPHAGNMLLTSDASLALIDAGMVAHLASGVQDYLLRLLVALTEGNGTEVVEVLALTGEQLEDFDKQALLRQVSALVAPVGDAGIGDLQVGRQLADLARASVESGLRPAPELTMLGKALLNLDDIARRLAPGYKPRQAISDHAMYLMRHRVMRASSPSNLVSAALEAKDLVEHLPRRVNRVLDSLAEGDFRMHIEGLNEAGLMRSVQKLANRCAAGLGVAAFVLAAAIFSVPASGPKWMGVSAFTVVFLGLAFVLGAGLVMATLRHDLPQRKKARRA